MNAPSRFWICLTTVVSLFSIQHSTLGAERPTTDALVSALGGDDEKARIDARQLLPRQSIDVVPKLLPLVMQDNEIVWRSAFNVLADFANQVSVPGREKERATVTANLMTLIAPNQSEPIKLRGLRLLPLVVPTGYDIGPVAALLDDDKLREKTRAALIEMNTPEARTAMREHLKKDDADFQCALLDGLGQLKDMDSLDAIEALTKSDNAKVRIAAMRALSWTGNPSYLKTAKAIVASADSKTHSDAMDAMLRLVNAIAEKSNRQIAIDTFLDLLKSDKTLEQDAALGALGRIGNGSCVAPILATIKDAHDPTRGNGVAALRKIQGEDVTREIIAAYPNLPQELQLALIPVLGDKKHAMVVPLLKEAAGSKDVAFRMAALASLGETGQAEGLDPLVAAAKNGSKDEKIIARTNLILLADTLKTNGQKQEAGKGYWVALETAADANARRQALEGVAACPSAEAYDAVKAAAADKDLQEPANNALISVGAALATAGKKEQAIESYKMALQMKPSVAAIQAAAKGLNALGVTVDLPGMLGVINSWWVVGPFDLGDKNEGWDKGNIGEPKVDLTARYMAGKRRLDWKHTVTSDEHGLLDLIGNVAKCDRCIGYAFTEITLTEPADAVLLLGVDDSERIWVNGDKVFEKFVGRGLQIDEDKVPVKLKAGANTILLEIWQDVGGWVFCARLATPAGQPLQFTQKIQN